jgi:hypothetical protein
MRGTGGVIVGQPQPNPRQCAGRVTGDPTACDLSTILVSSTTPPTAVGVYSATTKRILEYCGSLSAGAGTGLRRSGLQVAFQGSQSQQTDRKICATEIKTPSRLA